MLERAHGAARVTDVTPGRTRDGGAANTTLLT